MPFKSDLIMVEELYTKRLPITLKTSDREDRKCHVQVTIEMHTESSPVHVKQLVVRLTDDKDLFFLYTLKLNEEDFQSLKMQQGLLVDFGAFAQKFIDLLNLVLQEGHKEIPKFILEFVCPSLGSGTGTLNVTETNPFKHLTHLALKFLPGTDTDVKNYLADCLKALKASNSALMERYQHSESDLTKQLAKAREALSARNQELDSLKAEWGGRTSDLTAKHAHELNLEKEKAFQNQTSLQQRYDRERKELEQAHMKIVKQSELRILELESLNKDLTENKYKSESTIRELRSKVSSLSEETLHQKQELQSLRKNNAGLDSGYHEQEKVINQMKTRIAVLEQELKDKNDLAKKTSDLLLAAQQQTTKTEEEVERKGRHVGKLEMSVKTLTDELVKANEIIKKQHLDLKTYHNKLKLRNQVASEQEKLLGEKSKEMEELRKQLLESKTSIMQKEEEVKKLNESLEASLQKLDESKQLLKTNENVINWLNKQVTESQLSQQKTLTGPFEYNSASSLAYRPTKDSYAGQSVQTTPASGISMISSVHPQSAHNPQVHYHGHNVRRRSGLPLPLAKSSPLNNEPIAEERWSGQREVSPPHLSVQARRDAGDPILDSKYLIPSDQSRPQTTAVSSSAPLHFSRPEVAASSANAALAAVSMATSQPTKIGREVIKPVNAKPKTQAPLASAYFPTKVS